MTKDVYVVIGSNCFTGSHIVDALLAVPGNRVTGVSRSPEYGDLFLPYKQRPAADFRFYQIDLVRRFDDLVSLLDQIKPSVVINLAALSEVALSNERPGEYFEINTLGVVKLANYLRKCSYLEQYIHISSAEIYGSCKSPVTEDTLFNPSTPYAVSKAAADMYLNSITKNFDFPATIIRSTNVYGKHQQLFKIIPRTVIYLKRSKTIDLHGGGKAIKSFVHVRDVVAGLLAVIERGSVGTYHFSDSNDRTVADVVRTICGLMGRDFESSTIEVAERLGQDAAYVLDSSRARQELGWSPQISLERGLAGVISWVEDNWPQIQREPLEYVHKA